MTGHGWVIPLLGKSRRECGGPSACRECSGELAELNLARRTQPHPPLIGLRLALHDLAEFRKFSGGPSMLERGCIEAMLMAYAEIERLRAIELEYQEFQADLRRASGQSGEVFRA